ncbi:MAG: DUF4340 domain-containing protein [Archangium sp.]|nr:DUF4340 domain-containing protein [Archangium sp.]
MNKSTLIAVAVFGALAIAFFATRETEVKVGVRKLELTPVSSDALVEMVFGNINLRSTAGTWTVGIGDKRYSADEGQVKAALEALAGLKSDDFVTDRPEKHAELEVDSAKGLAVTASTGAGVVRELVLGKASRTGGAYVRAAKSDAVFALNGALPYLARKDVTAWRKKSIATTKVDDLLRVTFTPPSSAPWSLVSDSGSWKLEAQTPKDYRFDPAAAHRLVSQLCTLTAQDFTEARVEAPLTQVKAELKDGKSLVLQLGAKRADGTAPLSIEGDAQTYLLASWVVEQLTKDPEALRDTRLLRFDPAEVERVSLVTSARKTVVVKEGERWRLVEPKAPGFDFDAQQVTAQLNRLASFRAQKVVRDAVLSRPAVELELVTKGGVKQRLLMGELTAKGDDGLLYAVTAQDKSWLESGPELFKRPPPSPSGVQGLDQLPPELRKQLEEQLRRPP